MYESPLNIIYGEIQTKIIEERENQAIQALQNYGISVDKEELIKALMYDRQQYEKGYADAKAEIPNTSDTIGRQAAIDTMCELMHHWFGGDPKDEIREIKRELEKLPPAQPETIRCLECKHWDTSWQNKDWSPDCHYCPNVDGVRKSDFYCADAERRTE